MSTKFPPPETPSFKCSICSWEGHTRNSLSYHVNTFHEAVVAERGNRVQGKGGFDFESNRRFLLRNGYLDCPFIHVPCPGPVNPLARQTCEHLAECPIKEV